MPGGVLHILLGQLMDVEGEVVEVTLGDRVLLVAADQRGSKPLEKLLRCTSHEGFSGAFWIDVVTGYLSCWRSKKEV